MSWLAKVLAIFRPAKVEHIKRRTDRVVADYQRQDIALRVVRRAK